MLPRDQTTPNELGVDPLFSLGGGEEALKRAAGDLNWRNIQVSG